MQKNKKEILKDIFIPAAVLLFALAVWEIAALTSSVMATPVVTFKEMGEIIKGIEFWGSLGATFLRALIAFLISFLLALTFSVLASWFETIKRLLSPVITAIRSVPTMAIVLIFIISVSAGFTAVLVGMLVLFPTFYAALLPAAEGINKDLVEISLVCGANRLQRLRFVYLPSMAPAIAENAISGLSLAIKLVVSAEVLSQTAHSIGMMMQAARAYLQLERLIALTFMVVIVCVIIDVAGKAVITAILKDRALI